MKFISLESFIRYINQINYFEFLYYSYIKIFIKDLL